MKRVYVNEKWCLGCHLCEYNCAFANSGERDMVKAQYCLSFYPRFLFEVVDHICYAVSCRHCTDPLCVKGCIAGALSVKDGTVCIDHNKCVGCFTCILLCPYGAVSPGPDGLALKCELCLENACGAPACAAGCPNQAIVYEER